MSANVPCTSAYVPITYLLRRRSHIGKANPLYLHYLNIMAGIVGFEPTSSGFGDLCSVIKLHSHNVKGYNL